MQNMNFPGCVGLGRFLKFVAIYVLIFRISCWQFRVS